MDSENADDPGGLATGDEPFRSLAPPVPRPYRAGAVRARFAQAVSEAARLRAGRPRGYSQVQTPAL